MQRGWPVMKRIACTSFIARASRGSVVNSASSRAAAAEGQPRSQSSSASR